MDVSSVSLAASPIVEYTKYLKLCFEIAFNGEMSFFFLLEKALIRQAGTARHGTMYKYMFLFIWSGYGIRPIWFSPCRPLLRKFEFTICKRENSVRIRFVSFFLRHKIFPIGRKLFVYKFNFHFYDCSDAHIGLGRTVFDCCVCAYRIYRYTYLNEILWKHFFRFLSFSSFHFIRSCIQIIWSFEIYYANNQVATGN